MTDTPEQPVGHTAGDCNWRASRCDLGYGHYGGVTVTDNRGLVVAVALGDVPELDADKTARLIAAAPDLLEAAIEALDSMTVCGVVRAGDIHENDPTLGLLRAAITKATS